MRTKYFLIAIILLSLGLHYRSSAQVRYIFRNTSDVNQESYDDNDIYIYTQLGMPGMNGYYNTATGNWEDINGAGNFVGPDGNNYTDANARLSDLPVDANGQYYLDLPQGSTGRIYIGFGGPIHTWTANNPLLEDPGNPNYDIKVETIELTTGGQIFTNTSRVDRYAYPMGEELYCNNNTFYDKVGETITHEQVIAKWKLFVNDDFQNSYDPLRDIITQMGHTPYFQGGNPGNDYFDAFIDDIFTYFSTNTLQAEWGGVVRTATVTGNTMTWNDGTTFDRNDFELEAIIGAGAGSAFNNGIGQILGVCLNRGVVLLTDQVQVWDDPNIFFQNPIKNDYTHFFHSDFVSYEGKTYALAYDDVFDQSSTQSCQGTPDSVVISLGGFGLEHAQNLTSVYIDPQDPEIDQYTTIQLTAKGLDQGLIDMDIPVGATYTWTVLDPNGQPVNNLIASNDGLFGPTDITGIYTVSVEVEDNGTIYTASTTVTVNTAGTTGQVCEGDLLNNADYKLEVIGQQVYFTIVTQPGWNNTGYIRLFYGTTPNLGDHGANTLTANQRYPLTGVFFGDQVYFWVGTENNGGIGAGNPLVIPNLGTCQGLSIEEVIISLSTDQGVTIDESQTHQLSVTGTSNEAIIYNYPDPMFTEGIVFSGPGVDANGLFTPPGPGNYTIQVNYKNIVTTTTINVTSLSCNVTADLGMDQTICQDQTASVSLPAGTYTNVVWSGTGEAFLDDINSESPTFTPTGDGTFTLDVSAIDGASCGVTGTVDIIVNVSPTASITPPSALCEGDNIVSLTALVSPAGGTGTWTNATETTETTAEFDPATLGGTTVQYDYDLNGCSVNTDLLIDVNPTPTTTLPNLADFCEGDALESITATVNPAGGTGTWTNATETSETTADFDPTTAGNVTIDYVYDLNGCTANASTSFAVNSSPTASLPTLPDACAGDNVISLLATTNPTGGIGTWVNATKTSETEAEFDPINDGTFTIDYSYELNGCTANASTTIDVNVVPTASLPAMADLCVGDAVVSISATTNPAGGTGTWTGATETTETTADFDPTTAGNITVDYEYELNGCTANASTNFSVNASPSASLPVILDVCAGDNVVSLLATTNPTGGIGTWISATKTSETEAEFDPNSDGTYTISYDYVLNGCTASASATINVNVVPTVSLPAISDFCQGDAITNVLATVAPPGGTGTWINAAKTSETTADLNPSTAGDFEVEFSYELNGCTASTTSNTFTVTTAPTLSIAYSETEVCESSVDLSPVLSDGLGTVAISPITGALDAQGNFSPSASGPGLYTISYDYTPVGSTCPGQTAEFDITVNPTPTIDLSTNPSQICADATALTLSATPTGGTFSGSGVTGNTFDPSSISPTTGPFTISYEYTDAVSGCTASTQNFDLTVHPTDAPTGTSLSALSSDVTNQSTVPELCATGQNLSWYATSDLSQTAIASTSCHQPNFVDVAPIDGSMDDNVYSFFVTQTLNGCESSPLELRLTVTSCTTPAPSPTPLTICEGENLPTLNSGATGQNVEWTLDDGTTIIANSNDLDLATLGSQPTTSGTYLFYVSQEELDGSSVLCRGPQAVASLTINETPSISLSANTELCQGESTTIDVTTVSGNIASYTWTPSGSGSSSTVTPNASEEYTVTAVSGDLCSTSESINLVVTDLPEAQILGGDQIMCENEVMMLTNISNSLSNLTYTWYTDNGTTAILSNTSTLEVTEPGDYFVQVFNNGLCPTNSDTVEVTLEEISVTINASADTVDRNTEVTLEALTTGPALDYDWTTPNGSFSQVSFDETMVVTSFYSVIVSGEKCTASDDITIVVKEDLKVPNVFSPNGDGINDTWNIPGIYEFDNPQVTLFNRWGEQIFQSINGYPSPWDGTTTEGENMPSGTYYYVIDTKSEASTLRNGYLELMR